MSDETIIVDQISVCDKDPAAVQIALTALRARPVPADAAAPTYLAAGDIVILGGLAADVALAKGILGALPLAVKAEEQATRTYGLRVAASSSQVQFCLTQAGATVTQNRGHCVIVRASEAVHAALREQLSALDLLGSPEQRIVRLHHFRTPDAIKSAVEQVRSMHAPDVDIQVCGADQQRPMLLLCGPAEQVETMRREVALLDVPLPQMRLDLWSLQVSGNDPRVVTAKAERVQALVADTQKLVKRYLQLVETYAESSQRQEVEKARKGHSERLKRLNEALKELDKAREASGDMATAQEWESAAQQIKAACDAEHASAEDERALAASLGSYHGSLAMILARLALCEGAGEDHFRGWLGGLGEDHPVRLTRDEYASWAPRRSEPLIEGDPPDGGQVVAELTPRGLFRALTDRGRAETSGLSTYLNTRAELRGPDPVAPERVAVATANAQAELEAYEQALSDDIHRLFLRPLLRCVRDVIGETSNSGVASTGTTSVAVLSGTEAHVEASAVSYFDVTTQPKLDGTALTNANSFGTSLGTLFPKPTGGTETQYVSKATLTAGAKPEELVTALTAAVPAVKAVALEGALLLTGTRAAIQSALTLLRTGGVLAEQQTTSAPAAPAAPPVLVQTGEEKPAAMEALSGLGSLLGSVSGLPVDRLLSLALQLGPPDPVWEAMTEGTDLKFTPVILPGGEAAELQVDVKISHGDGAAATEGANAKAPLTRVAKHNATTKLNLEPLDLFMLSSFGLRTSRPRPDFVVPILGQIPLIGLLFRLPMGAETVHHQSLILVFASILPTATHLDELLVADSTADARLTQAALPHAKDETTQ